MAQWRDYKQGQSHTVVGTLLVNDTLYSPQLDNHRDVYVWLPNGYADTNRFYPVIYMHDGQNLFDTGMSYSGEWCVDETLTILEDEGLEAIVVGLTNNEHRMSEYSPYTDSRFRLSQPKGDAYVRWIIETVKPLIDADFRTLPQRETTGMMGSSMGGLITLYAFLTYPHVFGFAGAMSPSYWFGHARIYETVELLSAAQGRLYMDMGGKEGRFGSHYMQSARRLMELLQQKGYDNPNSFLYVEDAIGQHNEATWAGRLPNALRFLLSPTLEIA